MAFRFLTAFETLSVVQKCVSKLSLSNLICTSSRDFADEYYRHLPTQVSADMSMLSVPSNITEEETAQIKGIYQDCKRRVFAENAFGESNILLSTICCLQLKKSSQLCLPTLSSSGKQAKKTNDATKKMKLASKKGSNSTFKSTIGCRSDMVLYNKQKLAICVSELSMVPAASPL
ncbi:hypothetical protein EDC96DRAFT_564532 [Choanephora cucurbitarum]|nr:hypothetical protein EDC96DRAFT_564532 [Choanephora cucurbitarum]